MSATKNVTQTRMFRLERATTVPQVRDILKGASMRELHSIARQWGASLYPYSITTITRAQLVDVIIQHSGADI